MLKTFLFAGLVALGLGHALPASAQAQPPYFGQTRLVNADWTARRGPTGGQCIDVPYGTKAIGTVVQMFRCHDDLAMNQAFNLKDRAFQDTRIAVYDGNDERCLGFEDEGGKVNIADCASAPRWTMTDKGQIATADLAYCIRIPDNGFLELDDCNPGGTPDVRTIFGSEWQMSMLALHDDASVLFTMAHNACLDVRNGSKAPGASLMYYECRYTDNQSFQLLATPDNKLFISVYDNGRRLCVSQVPGGGGDWAQAVVCNRWDDRQAWRVESTKWGYFFRNVASDRCLDAYMTSNDTGTWPCHRKLNQEWIVIGGGDDL